MIEELQLMVSENRALAIPVAEIAALGAGVTSLITALNTVTQTIKFNTDKYYTLANVGPNDILKTAKNGNNWGSFITSEGKSKFLQIKKADPIITQVQTKLSINPAMMMMAISLASIEMKLATIMELQKEILGFLEREKKSKVETDVEILCDIISKYKYDWDNKMVMDTNYKRVRNIRDNARANIKSYTKQIESLTKSTQLINMQTQIKSKYNKLQDTFQYYRLAVYTYSLATLLEITLRGKFDDEYISINKSDLESLENQYREMFEKCSRYIEHLGNVSVEKNIINGVGILGKSAGKTIGSIPLINKGTVDELLIDGGKLLQDNARSLKQRYVHAFSKMNNPGVNVVMEQMKTLDNLYSNNSSIYIDKENVYLVSE